MKYLRQIDRSIDDVISQSENKLHNEKYVKNLDSVIKLMESTVSMLNAVHKRKKNNASNRMKDFSYIQEYVVALSEIAEPILLLDKEILIGLFENICKYLNEELDIDTKISKNIIRDIIEFSKVASKVKLDENGLLKRFDQDIKGLYKRGLCSLNATDAKNLDLGISKKATFINKKEKFIHPKEEFIYKENIFLDLLIFNNDKKLFEFYLDENNVSRFRFNDKWFVIMTTIIYLPILAISYIFGIRLWKYNKLLTDSNEKLLFSGWIMLAYPRLFQKCFELLSEIDDKCMEKELNNTSIDIDKLTELIIQALSK